MIKVIIQMMTHVLTPVIEERCRGGILSFLLEKFICTVVTSNYRSKVSRL